MGEPKTIPATLRPPNRPAVNRRPHAMTHAAFRLSGRSAGSCSFGMMAARYGRGRCRILVRWGGT
eukprot:24722-Chlamydomonas_euryale.AAC.4